MYTPNLIHTYIHTYILRPEGHGCPFAHNFNFPNEFFFTWKHFIGMCAQSLLAMISDWSDNDLVAIRQQLFWTSLKLWSMMQFDIARPQWVDILWWNSAYEGLGKQLLLHGSIGGLQYNTIQCDLFHVGYCQQMTSAEDDSQLNVNMDHGLIIKLMQYSGNSKTSEIELPAVLCLIIDMYNECQATIKTSVNPIF